jgi:hypothetical protein
MVLEESACEVCVMSRLEEAFRAHAVTFEIGVAR